MQQLQGLIVAPRLFSGSVETMSWHPSLSWVGFLGHRKLPCKQLWKGLVSSVLKAAWGGSSKLKPSTPKP